MMVPTGKYLGVSAGTAEGFLVTVDELGSPERKDQKMVLFSENLSPNLVTYFDRIQGILSHNGGLLSHLAILARERRLPVMVHFVPNAKFPLGAQVRFDASQGTLSRIQ
ncbi:MAG: hypothetical protein IPP35_02385 [Elusimicrobia bacterium]|nr:hypothetical protein [Elusimicrobiota bacterium]